MRVFNTKTVIVLGIALTCLVAAWNWRLSEPKLLLDAREITFDTYQRLKPRRALGQPIRIIDIDEAAIAKYGQWPWPRTQMAEMLDRLRELGALTVAFDMVFSERDRTGPTGFIRQLQQRDWPGRASLEAMVADIPDNDAVFAQSITKLPTVLGFFNEPRSQMGLPEIKAGFAMLGNDPKPILPGIESSVMSLPELQSAALGQGSISLGAQDDDVVRKVPMFSANDNAIYPSLSIEALRIVQGASTYVLKTTQASGEISGGGLAMTEFKVGDFIVPVTADGSMLIYATPMIADSFLSAARIFDDPVESLAPLIEGHLVFIGASASGLRDIRTSTLGESVPGVYMHAQIADQILSGEFLVRPDWATGAEIALMITLGALTVLILPLVGAIASAAFGATAAVAVLGGSWIAFSQYGLLIDPIFPMATGGAIFLLTTILLFAFAEREKRFVRGAFQRYLAPDLLGKLEQNPDLLKLGGEIREMTLLFMDVRGFTPISEKLSPEELVAFLNELLSPLSEIILKHEGAIDKYIGDSIMAFWNAPLDVDDHPKKALTAALAMIEEVERLNREDAFGFKRSSVDLDEVKIGIGINTGESCVGNMGSSRRFDYSVIGDTVNIAARIESSCKAVGWPLLVSADTASACPEFAMLEAGAIPLKGKSEPITLFAVIGDEAFANQESWRALKENHQKFMEAVARVDAQAARDHMAACLKTTPVDLTEFYEIHLASAETEVAAQ